MPIRVLSGDLSWGGGGGGGGGWCGVGAVIRESIDLSQYPCEYARALPVEQFSFLCGRGGNMDLWGENIPWSPPQIKPACNLYSESSQTVVMEFCVT